MTITQFNNLIEQLKTGGYHILYSTTEKWVYVSYKAIRKRFDLTTNFEHVSDWLNFELKPIK